MRENDAEPAFPVMKKLIFASIITLSTTALFGQTLTLSPTSGAAAGGTTVTITGTLGGCPIVPPCPAPTVRFGNSTPITATEVSGNEVTVRTPPHEAGTVDVFVTTRNGQTIVLDEAFTFVANTYAGWERIMIPVAVQSIGGNFNSIWTSEIAAYNAGTEPIHMEPCILAACTVPPNPSAPLPPNQARSLRFRNRFDAPATIMWVPVNEVAGLRLSARFRDTTGDDQSLGSELPVVRESELGAGTLHILDVPTDPRYRVNLRVYDLDAKANNSITIRSISMVGSETKSMGPVSIAIVEEEVSEHYGYAQVAIDSIVGTSQFPSVRLEVTPSNPTTRLWGFVTVTNNITQETTVISPQ